MSTTKWLISSYQSTSTQSTISVQYLTKIHETTSDMLYFLLSLAQEKFPTVNDSTVKARVILQNLKTLSYSFPPSDLQLAADFTQKLEELYHMFYSKLPNESGILIRPPDQKSLRSTRRREHTAHDANDYASLPPHKKKEEVFTSGWHKGRQKEKAE